MSLDKNLNNLKESIKDLKGDDNQYADIIPNNCNEFLLKLLDANIDIGYFKHKDGHYLEYRWSNTTIRFTYIEYVCRFTMHSQITSGLKLIIEGGLDVINFDIKEFEKILHQMITFCDISTVPFEFKDSNIYIKSMRWE